jgi:hypothetical protein
MTAYKSKDMTYMNSLKKAILRGMRGRSPDEKMYTWQYVRKQVTLDDLQSYAVSEIGKIVHFPKENFNAKIMVVFLHPPTEMEIEVLKRMMDASKVGAEDVYITYLGKAKADTLQEGQTLEKVLHSEISVIRPEMILSFGLNMHPHPHVVTDFKEAKLLVTYDMDYITKDHTLPLEDRKKALWEDVKQLMQYYNL